MSAKKTTFHDFMNSEELVEKKTRKKKKKSSRKKYSAATEYFGGHVMGPPASDVGAVSVGGGVGVGESLISEIFGGVGGSSFSSNQNAGPSYSKRSNDPEAGLNTINPRGESHPWDWAEEEEFEVPNTDDQVAKDDTIPPDVEMVDNTPLPDDAMGELDDDPDMAGIIRMVKKAHLVYKRQTEEGTFEELWIYNIYNASNDELDIRRSILAGTDIPPKKTRSPDGQQTYSVTTMGNAQMVKISGLSN